MPAGYALDISQNRGVFSPHPPKSDGWLVNPGELSDGREADLISVVGGGPSVTEGASFGKYICNEWNSHHGGDNKLQSSGIVHVEQQTLPDYRRAGTEQNVLRDDLGCS